MPSNCSTRSLLRDKLQDTLAGANTLAEAADRLAQEEDVFFSMRFLLQRPLLKAILNEQPTVLLIDEIDRADAEFEAFLLEVLSDFQVSVPELGTLAAVHRPLVLLTSNNTRELSEALKRRCLYLFIGYPSVEQEMAVVRLKVPELAPKLAQQAVELVHRLRNLDLRKSPSIRETLDWAKSLVALNAKQLDRETLENTLSVLLKHESDLQKVKRRVEVTDKGARGDDDDRPWRRGMEERRAGRIMEERMIRFITALRAGGVRISLAESADAFQAVDMLGMQRARRLPAEPARHAGQGRGEPADLRRVLPALLRQRRRPAAHVRHDRGHVAGRGADAGPGAAAVQRAIAQDDGKAPARRATHAGGAGPTGADDGAQPRRGHAVSRLVCPTHDARPALQGSAGSPARDHGTDGADGHEQAAPRPDAAA